MAAVVAAVSAVTFGTLASGTAAYGSTTYNDLTTKDYFVANENVYNTGTGKFYLETEGCTLNLTLTMNLDAFEAYQGVHDYANAGNYSSFVSWTYAGNANSTYGLADISSNHSSVNYSGITGMWNGSPWSQTTANRYITLDTLRSYADESGNVTLTINNNPGASSNHVTVTAQNAQGTQTLYAGDGLRSQNYTSQHITSFTVNMNYVTSVTLNTESTLNSSSFTPPKDYTIPFESERTDGTSVGRVLFMGDSITHGVEEMSWRWGLFKTFVDNGIENEIAGPLSGYHSDPLNSDYNGNYSSSQYGGETFDNAHYAQSSGRTHNMLTAGNSTNVFGSGTGVNYGGVSSAKVGKEYNADTYIMMMGTNDILSDGANTPERMATLTERLLGAGSVQNGAWVNADKLSALVGAAGTDPETAAHTGKWGTMGQIIDNIKMQEGDTMYVLSIPTWAQGRQNIQVYANYVPSYNENLKLWTEAYSASHTGTVKYVDINRGLMDKTLGGTFLGPNDFFRPGSADSLHPNEQGALIIAGNLAQGMGLAGRTAGLHRADSQTAGTTWLSGEAEYTINAGQSVNLATNAFDMMGGYTVDFSANFGNGATGGWLDKTNNALSISVGDGSNVGTLKLSEGYISWGDTKLLFCQDNSVQNNDNIRIAYHTGDADHQVGQGYYVWLGDMLIGQALTAGSGSLNGITLSSTGATGTVSGLTYSNTAYAPTTTGITSAENAFYATITKVLESHDNTKTAVSSGINWTGATDKSVAKAAVVTAASAFTDGKATINVTGTGTNFFGAANITATGSVEARVDSQTASSAFAVLGGTLTGDVTMEFSNSSVANGSFSGTSAALSGSYNGASIEGTFAAYIDNTSFAGDIVGGALTGEGSIDGVNLVLNSGAVNGTVYGGSKSNGTVGTGEGNAVSIAVNGGHITGNVNGGGTAGTVNGNAEITINGGIIDGNITGGDIQGQSTVTVVGNKASIGGNITADTVNLKNVEATEYTDAFDKYKGTITATNLVLDNYTAGKVNATLVTDYVTATNGTIATIHGLTLRNCSIDATGATALTLGETIHSGNTISYSGNIRLEDGTSFTIDNPTAVAEGSEGFSDGVYIYKVSDGQTGSLLAADGTALTGTHTATFTGTDALAGKLFSYESSTGALIAHSNTATYNIVSSTVDYSGISSAAGVTMSGGQLNLDTALTGGTITATGGTVNIGEGVTLAAGSLTANGATTVKGEGTYALASGTQVMPDNVSLSSDWTGIVKLTGNITDLNLGNTALGNAQSFIELADVTGRLNGADTAINAGIILSGSGLTLNNDGYSKTYTFNGSISGSGDIKRGNDGKNWAATLTFKGDVSDWTGNIIMDRANTVALNVNFLNEAKVINASLSVPNWNSVINLGIINSEKVTMNGALETNTRYDNSQMRVTIGSAQQVTSVDFTNTVHADTMTLMGASTAAFMGETTVRHALSAGNGTITVGGKASASLTVSDTATIGTLNVTEGATAVFNAATTLTKLNVGAGATVALNGTAKIHNDGWNDMGISAALGKLQLADGMNLNADGSAEIGTLVIANSASYNATQNQDFTKIATIHNLQSEKGATLNLVRNFNASNNTSYVLGGVNSSKAANTFDGTIRFDAKLLGGGQAQMVLADTDIASNAVLELNNTSGKTTYVGIAADTVKVQGITDAEGSTSLVKIYSGNTGNDTINGATDGSVRTLELGGSGEYSTAATLGANINLTMAGTGTQTFNGNLNGFNGLVKANGGKLVLDNSSAPTDAVALSGIFINNGTLELSGGKYTVGASSPNTNGLFAETKAVDTGSLVLSDGANLAVNATNNDWRFQVNSGEGAGIYVKDADSTLSVSLSDGGQVSFKALDATSETGARIAKNGGNGESFGVGKSAISVSDADYTLAYNEAVTVKNTLSNTAVTNNGTGKVSLDNAANTLVAVHAAKGDVDLLNTGDVSLAELSVGNGHTVSVVDGAALAAGESNVGNVTVTGLLTASEGSVLNANLKLARGAKVVSHGALTMGCTVTIAGDLILSVDGNAGAAPVAVFKDVESLTLNGEDVSMGWYDASTVLNSLTINGGSDPITGAGLKDYVIGYWNGTVSVAHTTVPEPATATLSLLALAAMAARRRRK